MTINNRIINVAICVSLPLFGNAAPKMQPQGSENAATSNLQATEDLAGEPSMDTEAARKLAVWNADRKKMGLLPISYPADSGDNNATSSRNARSTRLMAASASDAPVVSNVRMHQSGSDSAWYWISYDLDVPSRKKCNVSLMLKDRSTGETIPANTFNGGDIGSDIDPGQGKLFYWNALADWPGHASDQVFATITATEMDVASVWATVRIEWSTWGGRDLDICAYWADKPSQCVGWSWGTSYSDIDWESGDNTGSGPEYVRVSPEGSAGRRFIIRLNYYGRAGSSAKALIKVIGNGTKIEKEVNANGGRTSSKAEKGDPGAVVVFGEFGQPVSIESL